MEFIEIMAVFTNIPYYWERNQYIIYFDIYHLGTVFID